MLTASVWLIKIAQSSFSILEVAVDPSYSNFFLETLQKRPF
jgi:hypothetical protein